MGIDNCDYTVPEDKKEFNKPSIGARGTSDGIEVQIGCDREDVLFNIYRSIDRVDWLSIAKNTSNNVYLDVDVEVGETYYYKAECICAEEKSPESDVVSAIINAEECDVLTAPTKCPIDVKATDGKYTDRIVITWTSVADANAKEVHIFRDGILVGRVFWAETQFIDKVAPDSVHTYTLKYWNSEGYGCESTPDQGCTVPVNWFVKRSGDSMYGNLEMLNSVIAVRQGDIHIDDGTLKVYGDHTSGLDLQWNYIGADDKVITFRKGGSSSWCYAGVTGINTDTKFSVGFGDDANGVEQENFIVTCDATQVIHSADGVHIKDGNFVVENGEGYFKDKVTIKGAGYESLNLVITPNNNPNESRAIFYRVEGHTDWMATGWLGMMNDVPEYFVGSGEDGVGLTKQNLRITRNSVRVNIDKDGLFLEDEGKIAVYGEGYNAFWSILKHNADPRESRMHFCKVDGWDRWFAQGWLYLKTSNPEFCVGVGSDTAGLERQLLRMTSDCINVNVNAEAMILDKGRFETVNNTGISLNMRKEGDKLNDGQFIASRLNGDDDYLVIGHQKLHSAEPEFLVGHGTDALGIVRETFKVTKYARRVVFDRSGMRFQEQGQIEIVGDGYNSLHLTWRENEDDEDIDGLRSRAIYCNKEGDTNWYSFGFLYVDSDNPEFFVGRGNTTEHMTKQLFRVTSDCKRVSIEKDGIRMSDPIIVESASPNLFIDENGFFKKASTSNLAKKKNDVSISKLNDIIVATFDDNGKEVYGFDEDALYELDPMLTNGYKGGGVNTNAILAMIVKKLQG